jgi:hypothetical protein
MNPISSIYDDEQEGKNKQLDQYHQMLQQQIFENRRMAAPAEEAKEAYAPKDEDKKDNLNDLDSDKNREDRWVKLPDESNKDNAIYGEDLKYKQTQSAEDKNQSLQSNNNDLQSNHGLNGGLSPEDDDMLRRLRARDQEVRNHELAHAASLGRFKGVVNYSYQLGPDGKLYAIGGSTEVAAGATTSKADARARAEAVRRAAGAVADPSNADIAAGLDATQQENKLRLNFPFDQNI